MINKKSEKALKMLQWTWHIIWSLSMIVFVVAYIKGMIEPFSFLGCMDAVFALLIVGLLEQRIFKLEKTNRKESGKE